MGVSQSAVPGPHGTDVPAGTAVGALPHIDTRRIDGAGIGGISGERQVVPGLSTAVAAGIGVAQDVGRGAALHEGGPAVGAAEQPAEAAIVLTPSEQIDHLRIGGCNSDGDAYQQVLRRHAGGDLRETRTTIHASPELIGAGVHHGGIPGLELHIIETARGHALPGDGFVHRAPQSIVGRAEEHLRIGGMHDQFAGGAHLMRVPKKSRGSP